MLYKHLGVPKTYTACSSNKSVSLSHFKCEVESYDFISICHQLF